MTHPTDTHIGNRVRFRRTMLGMSQQTLAAGIGVTFQQIQKYESGKNRISAGKLWDFATILKMPVSYFYEGLDKEVPPLFEMHAGKFHPIATPEEVPENFNTRATMNLIRAFYGIPCPKTRTRLLELMRAIGGEEA